MDTKEIAPSPLKDKEIEALKHSLRKAANDLHEVVITLKTPIAAVDFPDSIKKAIRQHQQDCCNPIEEISQRLPRPDGAARDSSNYPLHPAIKTPQSLHGVLISGYIATSCAAASCSYLKHAAQRLISLK